MKHIFPFLVIFLLVAAYLLASIFPLDRPPPTPIATEHSVSALQYYHFLKGTPSGKLIHPFRISNNPPLSYLVTALFFFLGGPAPRPIFFSLAFFLALLLVAVYAVGRQLKNGRAGLLACVLTVALLCFWEVEYEHEWFAYAFLREYFPGILLAALVVAALGLIDRSGDFTSPGSSLWFGIVFGLGMITKWPFLLYLAPAAVYTAWKGRRDPKVRRNLLRAALPAGLLIIPCYFIMIYFNRDGLGRYLWGEISMSRARALGFPPPVVTWWSWLFYPAMLARLMTPPVFILFLYLFFRFLRRRRSPVISLAILSSYVLLSLLPGKFLRPLVPLLPLCALVVGVGCADIASPALRRLLSGAIILLSIWIFAAHYGLLPPAWPLSGLVQPPRPPLSRTTSSVIRTLLKDIEDLSPPRRLPAVSVVPFQPDFRLDSFIFWSYCDRRPIDSGLLWKIKGEDWKQGLEEADFVISMTGDLGPDWAIPHKREIELYLRGGSPQFPRNHEIVREYPLPGGEVIRLYARRAAHTGFSIFPAGKAPFSSKALAAFGDRVRLIDFSAASLPDRRIRLRYSWECRKELARNYKIFVHFRQEGRTVFRQDHFPAHRRYPTPFWRKGEIIQEEYLCPVPAPAPSGKYQIWVGLWDGITRLSVMTDLETNRGAVRAGEVTVEDGDR